MKVFLLQIFVSILMLFTSCNSPKKHTKELLIYCGVTMAKPMLDIVKEIEQEENCKIHILTGGSEDLLKSIMTNKQGDLYLPGSELYVLKGLKEKIITDTVLVGKNRAVMMVKKGNPKKVEYSLTCCENRDLRVVIANPHSSSIGQEAKRMFEKKGIYQQVSEKTVYFAADSKDLLLAIREDKADMVVNWYAPFTWDNNQDFIDIIKIPPELSEEKKLYLSVLSYSKYPEIAKKVLAFTQTDKGKEIFTKYGF